MNLYKLLMVLVLTVFISGCESMITSLIPKGEAPKNAQAFRLASKTESAIVENEFIVNKPLSYVIKRWKKRYKPCLDATYRKTYVRRDGFFDSKSKNIDTGYNSKLKVYRKKAVLTLQMEKGGMHAVLPPGGMYVLVLDAKRIKGNKTRIVEYRWDGSLNFDIITNSVVNWASGKSTACPDYGEVNTYKFFK